MAYAALEAGYATHRFNLRSCGGTEALALSNYHSGQTSDVLHVLRERKRASGLPRLLAGFSLGGNVALKLAGELGESGAGAAGRRYARFRRPSISPPARTAIGERAEFHLSRRFLARLKRQDSPAARQAPELYTAEHLKHVRTIYDFDDYYTARLFGFGTADNYYRTQSSNQFLEKIRVPTLVITAKDDPLIPFSVYDHPAFHEESVSATGRRRSRRPPRIHRPAPAAILAGWRGARVDEEFDTTLRERSRDEQIAAGLVS